MFYTKTIIKNGRKVKLGISIEKMSERAYKITEILYSRNGKDFNSMSNDVLKKNELKYVIAQTFGVDNKLLYKGKRLETCEIGTLTIYYVDDNIILPCSLIDNAIDAFPKI